MKRSGPFFHDVSQENLYLKSELSRCHKLIAELEASYFHQKNNKLLKENNDMKEKLQQLSAELTNMSTKEQHASHTSHTLHQIRAELLDKIVALQELLSAETYKRKAEIQEKHKLHIAKIKIEAENKHLHQRISHLQASIEQKQNALLQAKQQTELIKAENGRLKEQIVEKEYQLKHIKIEVDHMKDRIIETKERLLEIEKTKEKLFHETIISYKRQLDESDAWIASHFADIDGGTKQTEKTEEEAPAVYAQPNHVETILEDVTKQIHALQKQLVRAQSSDQSMSHTIEELKNRAAEEKPYQKWVYKLNLEKENKPSQKKTQ
ncbi:sporulation protein [Bacillus inaquosorum]|uniref:sporulation protein n=1 Tax=Bacillus inaquosorum TaxID=483913 RepID=UPI00227F30AE|nr:sporulation protein [Bacillus inaquosorum]MCY7748078.1 sporulation protein [Bacillus inaquosorum]MCY7962354.1 sporulation protein [Bacillus inaquosorum]MCY8184977.1 sporulation protein [Bacillus inaquosorum]